MKTIYLITILFVGLTLSFNLSAQEDEKKAGNIEVNSEDSVEYELIVFDPGFETYLATVPHQKEYYSNSYLRGWNIQYCAEWNNRHHNPFKYGDFYETSIPYDPSVDYGIDFNFKLYQYFQFIEKEHGIVLINRKGN